MAARIPASVRHKNPGAQWPGTSSKKFGAIKSAVLNDAQRNQIATFPTSVHGAAALFDLLYRVYAGLTFSAAIAKWSGGNHINDYLRVIEKRTHWTRDDYVSKGLLEDPALAIKLGKAMAYHEAGREYPMTDAEWHEAHAMFMAALGGAKPKIQAAKPVTGAPWMDLAQAAIGTKEIAGFKDNPEIMSYYADAGHPNTAHDETPWCAAFVSAMLERSGCANPKTLLARDFLEYGESLSEPEEGCIVVFWRVSPNSWQGHVGFVTEWTATTVKVLGGNQADSVNVQTFKRSQVLGYRRPVSATKTVTETVKESPSLQMMIYAQVAAAVAGIVSWWDALVGSVSSLAGVLPFVADHTTTTVGAAQRIATQAGMPLPAKMLLALTFIAVATVLYRQFWQKRERPAW